MRPGPAEGALTASMMLRSGVQGSKPTQSKSADSSGGGGSGSSTGASSAGTAPAPKARSPLPVVVASPSSSTRARAAPKSLLSSASLITAGSGRLPPAVTCATGAAGSPVRPVPTRRPRKWRCRVRQDPRAAARTPRGHGTWCPGEAGCARGGAPIYSARLTLEHNDLRRRRGGLLSALLSSSSSGQMNGDRQV